MSLEDFLDAEACLSRSAGHCMTMGTASTMASMCEALGLQLPTGAAIPAVDSRRYAIAELAGPAHRRDGRRGALDLEDFSPATRSRTPSASTAAIGGSTNAIVHLLAIAGRLGVQLRLDDFDDLIRDVPFLVNLQPSGEYLMEDFYYAGGLPVVMKELGDALHTSALSVSGRTIGENVAPRRELRREGDPPRASSRWRRAPARRSCAAISAPDGAVIKQSAATAALMQHRGRAVVFDSIEDLHERLDDPDLDIDESCVMVLKNAGPRGYPGMPEVGNLPLPKKVLEKGIDDMVRISDARMSGTCFGTIVLHVAPRIGDRRPARAGRERRHDHPSTWRAESSLSRSTTPSSNAAAPPGGSRSRRPTAATRSSMSSTCCRPTRGVDFDFLRGGSGSAVPRTSH